MLRPTRRAPAQQWAGLKFFNVYGPERVSQGFDEERSVVRQISPKIAAGGKPAVAVQIAQSRTTPTARQMRDFVHGSTIASTVMLWLARQPAASTACSIMGTGKARSFADLATRGVRRQRDASREIELRRHARNEIRDKYQYFTRGASMDRLRASRDTRQALHHAWRTAPPVTCATICGRLILIARPPFRLSPLSSAVSTPCSSFAFPVIDPCR